jgi:glycosyltransferase involved in cell wall biosynthesis
MKKGHEVFIVELGRHRYAEFPHLVPCPVLHLDHGPVISGGVPLGGLGFRSWLRHFGSLAGDVGILVKGNFELGNLALEAAASLRFRRYLVIEHIHAPLSGRATGRHFNGLVPGIGLWWFRKKFSGYLRSIFPHKVICVSHAVAATLRKDYHYPPSKLVVAHSGVNTSIFAPSPLLRDLARKDWGVPETAFVFGTLGRLSPMKNHRQLINAFSQLCKSNGERDIRLVIVGDGPLRSSLEGLAHSTGVRKRVVFGGFTENPERILQAFDVFCFPSTTGESLGIALLEAMSCGCPPIAADTGGVPEILNDPRLGWLIRSGDESDLLSAMRHAAGLDKETLHQLGANARERVLSCFEAEDRWGELVAVIEAAAP